MRVFDLHCDTITECWKQGQPLRRNTLRLDLERGRMYSPWAQCFAIWIPDTLRGEKAWEYFEGAAGYFRGEVERNWEAVSFCTDGPSFSRAAARNRCCAFLTVEGGAVLGGKLSRVKELAQAGVRMLTLTWNGSCELGDGAMVLYPKGLTAFGRQVIPELERWRIVLDLSHASLPLFYQAAELAHQPFVASHSNAKAVCSHPRNLTDAQFTLLCQKGGLVGLNLHPAFLTEKPRASVEDLLRHAEHFLSLGGEDVLALGSDLDGGDLPEDVQGIESFAAIWERFSRAGYPDALLEKIFYENAQKFFLSL